VQKGASKKKIYIHMYSKHLAHYNSTFECSQCLFSLFEEIFYSNTGSNAVWHLAHHTDRHIYILSNFQSGSACLLYIFFLTQSTLAIHFMSYLEAYSQSKVRVRFC